MIQLAIGLRAAVSIASERESGTWDALLTSQLEPGEIVYAKVYGSLYALRWFLGAIVLAWTLGVGVGAIPWSEYANWTVSNLAAGILMAAIGVRCSLSLATATKSMTWTVALWLGSTLVVYAGALAILCLGYLTLMAFMLTLIQLGFVSPQTIPLFGFAPVRLSTAWIVSTNAVTLLIALLLILDTRLRFDRIAGRITGGAVEATVDAWIHGEPGRPVLMDRHSSKPLEQASISADTMQAPEPVG